jgi:hypothetical protein
VIIRPQVNVVVIMEAYILFFIFKYCTSESHF